MLLFSTSLTLFQSCLVMSKREKSAPTDQISLYFPRIKISAFFWPKEGSSSAFIIYYGRSDVDLRPS